MTVSSTTTKHIYEGNGTTVNWPFTFPIISEDGSEIKVYITDDEDTVTELNTGYDVDINNSQIVYPGEGSGLDILPSGYKITLSREMDLDQELHLTRSGPLDATTLETAYDKLTMITQQHEETLSRCVKYPIDQNPTDSETSTFLTAIEAAKADAEASATAADASADAAALSESNAATSESNAATSESNASTSESNAASYKDLAKGYSETATTQAGIATTQAGNAASSAEDAATSEGNAADSEATALSYKNAAELAKSAAEDAQGYAEAAQSAAEDAQSAAEDAQDAAEAAANSISKFNKTATVAPTTGDDSNDGYDVNSIWVDVTHDQAYICLDATVGAAVWRRIGGGNGGSALNWRFDYGPSPIENAYANYVPTLDFPYDAVSGVTCLLTVPSDYALGAQILLKGGVFGCAAITNKVKFKATTYLIQDGSTVLSSLTNSHDSVNAQVTVAGVADTVTAIGDIDLTDTAGKINSVSVAAGNKLLVLLIRDVTNESSSAADDARLVRDSLVPYFG